MSFRVKLSSHLESSTARNTHPDPAHNHSSLKQFVCFSNPEKHKVAAFSTTICRYGYTRSLNFEVTLFFDLCYFLECTQSEMQPNAQGSNMATLAADEFVLGTRSVPQSLRVETRTSVTVPPRHSGWPTTSAQLGWCERCVPGRTQFKHSQSDLRLIHLVIQEIFTEGRLCAGRPCSESK